MATPKNILVIDNANVYITTQQQMAIELKFERKELKIVNTKVNYPSLLEICHDQKGPFEIENIYGPNLDEVNVNLRNTNNLCVAVSDNHNTKVLIIVYKLSGILSET